VVLLMTRGAPPAESGSGPNGPKAGEPVIVATDIEKRFGGVQALKGVSVTIAAGSIHALVGENGAGKSTLGRVLGGAMRPDGGTLQVGGQEVRYHSPRDALRAGVALIAQELELVPRLTVAQNIMLGHEPQAGGLIARAKLRRRAIEIIEGAGFDLSPDRPVSELRVAEQQQVEILRAIAWRARLIVMDEPTTALTITEVDRLAAMVRALARAGTSIVYVSHNLKEVLALADTVTVLRNGSLVKTTPAHSETESSLVEAILGRSTDVVFPDQVRPRHDAAVVLSVQNAGHGPDHGGISLELRQGEILGVAGLLGSGRSRLARLLFQAEQPGSGQVLLDGRQVGASPHAAYDAGLVLLPEDRRGQGLIMGRSIAENLTLPHLRQLSRRGLVSGRRSAKAVTQLIEDLRVVTPSARATLETLSGGNQQKVLFGKCLLRHPKVLILDEPTRGVDIGAKLSIYTLIQKLAKQGMGVIVISSELEEVLGLAHRVLVMRDGEIVAELPNDKLDPSTVMHAAFGVAAARSDSPAERGLMTT
jgi:ABC-type sugar transport system ATPase subunit